MSHQTKTGITRRRFLLLSAMAGGSTAFASMALGISSGAEEKKRLTEDTLLKRNPAFSMDIRQGQPVLSTMTTKGKSVAFRMDEEGAFLWRNVPTAEEHMRGTKMTVRSLLDLAAKDYGKGQPETARAEALAFLERTFDADIVLDAEAKIYVAFKPLGR